MRVGRRLVLKPVTDRLALYAGMRIDSGLFKQPRDIPVRAESPAGTTAERFWLTEIQRYQGQLALAERVDHMAAERLYHRVFAFAEEPGARGFGLRAAVDRTALLEQQGGGRKSALIGASKIRGGRSNRRIEQGKITVEPMGIRAGKHLIHPAGRCCVACHGRAIPAVLAEAGGIGMHENL